MTVVHILVKMTVVMETKLTQFCMGTVDKEDISPLTKLYGAVPLITLPIVSLVFDLKIVGLLKKVHPGGNASLEREIMDNTLPVRATVFSAAMAGVYTVSAAMWASTGMDMVTRSASSFCIVIFFNAVRCSVSTRMTYVARQRATETSREERQEAERTHARNARVLRRRLMAGEESSTDPDLEAVRAITQKNPRNESLNKSERPKQLEPRRPLADFMGRRRRKRTDVFVQDTCL